MDGIEGFEANTSSDAMILNKDLFRIGEVSRVTSTKPFVLRYWETEFPMLQPVKSPKGHRLYRREDIETVLTIKRLLYDEGFTIAGARKHLREHLLGGSTPVVGFDAEVSVGAPGAEPMEVGSELRAEAAVGREQDTPRTDFAQRIPTSDLAMLNRKTLLDLRDSLRSLLTVLESE